MREVWLAASLGVAGVCPLPASVLYDLSSTRLDGTTGENTYSVGATGGLSYNSSTPSLTWNLATASPGYNYFVAYFEPTTLTVGQSIKLTYSFTPSSSTLFSNSDSAFRLGIFNSNGSELTGNVTGGVGSATLNGYRGYQGLYPGGNNAGTANSALYTRSGNGDNLWDSSTRTKLTGSPTPTTNIGTSTVTGSYEILLLTETTLQITSIINGAAAQSVVVSSNLIKTFDSISILGFPTSYVSPSATFTDLTVSVIPEPSTMALVLGGTLLAVAVTMRRRRAA